MAIRVRVREFRGTVFTQQEGVKEYRIREWELDDGTFEYGLDCPLHQRTYFKSKSKEVVG